MQENNQSKTSKWLEMLQQESWQLELIISGFAIFLVGGLREPLFDWGFSLNVASHGFENDILLALPVVLTVFVWLFLLLNLILHVILRGLWISTIGLRYVSDDIDWEGLRLHPKFDAYLRRKVGSYDSFIERLERLCSIVFAFTFMIIFMSVSFVLFVIFMALVHFALETILGYVFSENVIDVIDSIIQWTIFITGFIYFLDFLTLGWMKRKKWLSKIYFPFYRFYSRITLAFLYRPIYYNLVDNKYGRRLSKLLVPYVLLVIFLSTGRIVSHPYYPISEAKKVVLKDDFYLDEWDDEPRIIVDALLPSKYVSNGFLDLFIGYEQTKYGKAVQAICPDFENLEEVGLKFNMLQFTTDKSWRAEKEATIDSSLFCLQQLYEIKVNDSLFQNPIYRFYEMEKYYEQRGLKTILDVAYLPRGEHILYLKNQTIKNDSLQWEELCQIPFWKE